MKSNTLKNEIIELINKISDNKQLNSILIFCKNSLKQDNNSNDNNKTLSKFKTNDLVRVSDRKSIFFMKAGIIVDYDTQAKYGISYFVKLSNSEIIKFSESQLKKEGN